MSEDPNFEAFVKSLESAPTTGLGKDAEYALWINSYNALAILTVVQNSCKKRFCGLKTYKISSIKGSDPCHMRASPLSRGCYGSAAAAIVVILSLTRDGTSVVTKC